MKSLGQTLKDSRELIPLTLRQVEEATGISNAYLSQLENEKIKKPSANVLYKLASVYNVSLNDLLAAAGIIQKSEPSKKGKPNREWEKRIAFYTDKMTDEQKDQILEYIKFVKSKK